VIRVYHRTYTRLSNAASIFRQTRDRSLSLTYSPMCTKRPIATLQLMSRDPRHRGLSVSNGEVQTLVLQAAQCTRRIHASLQPREILHQSSDLAALLQQFVFISSLMIFYVFSQSLDHIALFHEVLNTFTHVAMP